MVACGNCLSEAVVKEADLLFSSSTPLFLLAGLSVAFLSSDLHVIPYQVLSSCKDPLHAEVNKVFLPEQAKAITAEFEAVSSLGISTKDGWLLGLEARGKIAFADHARWDKWLVSGGVHKMRTCLQSSSLFPSKAPSATAGAAPVVRPSLVSPHAALVASAPEPKSAAQGPAAVSHAQTAGAEQAKTKIRVLIDSMKPSTTVSQGADSLKASPQAAATSEKSLRIIDASKSHPKVDDRSKANLQAVTTSRGNPKVFGYPEAKPEVADKSKANPQVVGKSKMKGGSASEDAALASVKSTIASLADEVIHSWNRRQKVSDALAPEFAAAVLLEVRRRFLADIAPGGGQHQFLTLKDMVWIADNKISKYTRPNTSIFWCNGCQERANTYKIQGVIQHYADKHTKSFSSGKTVVNWSAEWSETPPFDPHPQRRMPGLAIPKSKQPKKASEKKANPAPSSAKSVPQSNTAQPSRSQPQLPPPAPAPSGRKKLPPAEKAARSQYIKRLNFMADSCKQIWDRMDKVVQLHDAAKAYLLVHYIVREVESKFPDRARIDIFYDGLSHERKMQDTRSLKCLHCRACGLDSEDQKPLSLLQLVEHFRARHEDSLDWRVDMMSPPAGRASFGLMESLAKSPAVLALAADALPHFLAVSSGPSSQRVATYAGSPSASFDSPRMDLQPAGSFYSRWDQVERYPYGDRSREPMVMRDGGSGAHDQPANSALGALVPFDQRHVGPDDAVIRHRSMAYAHPDRQPRREYVTHRRYSDQAADSFQPVDVRGRGQMDYALPRLPPAGVVQAQARGHVVMPGVEWRQDKEEYDPRYPAANDGNHGNHGRGRVRDSSA
ncbi:F-box domain containing protein [Ophiocordyceps camponoti-floridani]|uniref:F-box domain containing protein n=1 Tax=Ophiocordyceps camponoti-floridani TaxID=2030778 RepID=A0A8H4QBJ8_9HYPO|nr:F-box domain containing protein [Ophiocordyceps camponoti-floridani]